MYALSSQSHAQALLPRLSASASSSAFASARSWTPRPRPRPLAQAIFVMTRSSLSSSSSSPASVERAPMSARSSTSTAATPMASARIAHIVALPIPLSAEPTPRTQRGADADSDADEHHHRLLHPAKASHQNHIWLFLSPPTLPAAPPEPNHHTHARFTRGWWAHKLSHEWPVRVSHEWTELNQPDAAQWKRKVHAWGSKLLAALPWTELVAKKWVAPVEHVVLYHPAGVEAVTAHRQLSKFVVAQLGEHVKWRKISALGLPFSVMAGILPGPNLPLLYNAFRVYSHHIAAANLASVNASIHDAALSTVEIPALDPLVSQLSPASSQLDLNSPDLRAALSASLGIVGQASTIPEHLRQSTMASEKYTESQPLLATHSDQLASDVLHALRQESKKYAKTQP
ncbi:mitochondrial K+-H+ exchange-related-domain-containing protein [Catenaria anguillulae PL171]|uniref:Mitochondrial K+-H+ exchange-related-domain-containing protein n=1 Tax=Catenaria anguillulae PL171 TaxID=765915 RepID=A0A1Y2H6S3_9FUNG|nr:mitochondrial K+-H+ exchange-related-domain-containing protein [Catenaria anguillulae PL171]